MTLIGKYRRRRVSKRQLLDYVATRHSGVPFDKMEESDLKALSVAITENFFRGVSEKERQTRLNGKEVLISYKTMVKWKSESPSDKSLRFLSIYLGYQNFEEFRKDVGSVGLMSVPSLRLKLNRSNVLVIVAFTLAVGLLLTNISTASNLSILSRYIISVITTRLDENTTENQSPNNTTNEPLLVSLKGDTIEVKSLKVWAESDSAAIEAIGGDDIQKMITSEITVSIDEKFAGARFYQDGSLIVPSLVGVSLLTFKVPTSNIAQEWMAITKTDTCYQNLVPETSKMIEFLCD